MHLGLAEEVLKSWGGKIKRGGGGMTKSRRKFEKNRRLIHI